MTLPMAVMEYCSPMGRPMTHSSRARLQSQRQSPFSIFSTGKPRHIRTRHPTPAMAWERMVAKAAPNTSMWKVRINTKSSTIFSREAAMSQITGVRLSPRARRTPAA